jgi:hypothetical protein
MLRAEGIFGKGVADIDPFPAMVIDPTLVLGVGLKGPIEIKVADAIDEFVPDDDVVDVKSLRTGDLVLELVDEVKVVVEDDLVHLPVIEGDGVMP